MPVTTPATTRAVSSGWHISVSATNDAAVIAANRWAMPPTPLPYAIVAHTPA